MIIKRKRARAIFTVMLERYHKKELPFFEVGAGLPQDYAPQSLVKEPAALARYYFFLCLYMRGGIDSVTAAERLTRAYNEHPWLFDERVLLHSVEEVQTILASYIALFKNRIGGFWMHNATVLWRYWGGDPRRLFTEVRNPHEVYYRLRGSRYRPKITKSLKEVISFLPPLLAGAVHYHGVYPGFIGFKEKMTSMLAYFLFQAGLVLREPPLSAPVDFHHLRIYVQTGMIAVGERERVRYEHLKDAGILLAQYLQQHFKLTLHEYGDIVWLWSRDLCSRAPHN